MYVESLWRAITKDRARMPDTRTNVPSTMSAICKSLRGVGMNATGRIKVADTVVVSRMRTRIE